MSLRSEITNFVNTAWPAKHPSWRGDLIDALDSSGQLYLSSDNILCVKAVAASAGKQNGSSLPTRISASARSVLTALEELADVGIIDDKGKLHSRDAGVTVQVIP